MEHPVECQRRGAANSPGHQLPLFTVVLFCSSRLVRRDVTFADIDELISSCPFLPVRHTIISSGSVAGRLLYRLYDDALNAVLFFWGRRLDGAHLLTPLIVSASDGHPLDEFGLESRVKSLFCDHIRGLFAYRGVRLCEQRIDELSNGIKKVSVLLSGHNGLRKFHELKQERNRLEVEKEQLENRLFEFRAAMGCLLGPIEKQEEKLPVEGGNEDGKFEIFKLGDKLNWNRIHRMMERECRRLEEGLPIYAFRRKILSHIFSNQVMVMIGETGSGKSTQLVQYLADSGLGKDGAILCTQPRKIAASSLAQRVGEETNGCYSNNFVISYPSYSYAQELSSGVIFMTDHCLLQHFMNGKNLDGISCIIIDEAHERSLNTDLLLALIKKKLIERLDLRLIIMSATVDASKLKDYFYDCCICYVTGRNFPVEIKYVPDISAKPFSSIFIKDFYGKCASYVVDVLKMVSMIHKTEEDGAILAFLTSQMEVEWACDNFTEPTAVVLPMHGKLSIEEQRQVFQNYPGKRKVIFCTNIAETSLTIKGVKYVVDSGMVKESRYEPDTGMNVLKVSRVSQSSANQRAGRAGRTQPGKCYRLYSELDFQAMDMHQEPEICKVHLGIAILRILALGIKNFQDFEFIDAPCPEAIEVAIQNLIYLGAVIRIDGVFDLTETGWKLVKLGVEPRLGKIILDCFHHGLSKEGLVLAAVMANASSIFCRVGSEENKCKADCLKVPFCHHDGDLFTFLSVYKKWEGEQANRKAWCWKNSINAKSMKRCQEAVSELESCLQHELNIIIPTYWLWNPDEPNRYDKLLKKVILSSLADNIAMFTGRDRLGYEVALTGKCIQLHPSCSLLVYGKRPTWVVFGEILSLSNDYLVCVTAVDFDDLVMIQTPLFDVYQLESGKMLMNVVTGVGNNLLKRFCGKLNNNLQRLISHAQSVCSDNHISIDIDFEKNEVHVFASKKDMEQVSGIVKDTLEYEKRCLRNECTEKCLFPGRPGISSPLALFGSGAEIKHLELERRFLSVEIFHPNSSILTDKEFLMMVDKHVLGIANYHKYAGSGQEGADRTKWGRITFLTPDMAANAVTKLNKVEFDGSILKANPIMAVDHKIIPSSAVRVKVCWPRRPCKGVAIVTCAAGEAEFVVSDCFSLSIGGRYVGVQISQKHQNCVFVTGLPRDVREEEMYEAFIGSTKRKILDIHLLRGEAIANPPPIACEEALIKEITPFMPNKRFCDNNFHVEVFEPEPRDLMMRAMITFDGSLHLEAAKALDHIEGKILPGCLSWQKIQCQHVFHSSVSFPARVYVCIRKSLDSLLEDFKHQRGVSYNLEKNYNGSYRVKISANATKTIADLRRPLEQLIKGKIVSHPNLTPAVLQLILCRDGVACLKAVERETGTYVLYDRHSLNIRIFGAPRVVSMAEEKLVCSLVALHENKPFEIHLSGRNLPPDLMKEVVKRFGSDLQGLKDNVPGVEVTLNTRFHKLYVRGSKENMPRVEDLISKVALSINQNGIERPPESYCPVCLCELEDPYVLEACGHTYCRSCLVDQCESAIRTHEAFPLCCIKEGCKELILLIDLKSLLLPDKLEELFRASLSTFVASSDGTYRFCPTPDCPNVYRVASYLDEEVRPFICGSCLVETCKKCHLEYHPFISCETYMEYKEDPDLSLAEWCKGKDNVNNCPGCGFTIEKIEGCNHIECRCGRHICWLCLDFFRSSDECYSHLRSVHQLI
ncbi:ATP-dependent RNA helicase DEAH11, chloroplastic-like isoform X1 [Canna indica]|uniref:RNA helicase n=1 Tax=Canna indica TaxID=4628 RepID=A0AAQ3QLR0_9LILI|nr:ATP-dependent RNA helicase DEAH11, chloroplastic-like isoform X1 [Canna indica]